MSGRKIAEGPGAPAPVVFVPPGQEPSTGQPDSSTAEVVPALATAGARTRSRRGMLWWIGGLVVAAVVGVGAVLGARLGTDPTLVRSPLIGKPAPSAEWSYLEKDGVLQLADLRGQVVVVNFWASWCVPCRAEHPELVAAADAYADAGVTFVGVNYQDQKATAVAFLDELGRGERYEYVVDTGSRGGVDFGVYGVPETFVIDRDGTIVAKIMGVSNFPLLASTLDQVLAGSSPGEVVNGPVQREPGG